MRLFKRIQNNQPKKTVRALLIFFLFLFNCTIAFSQQPYPNQAPVYPVYNPSGENNLSNYSADNPFKTEVARIEAFVHRPGKETLPLMDVPRLNQGDTLRVKVINEAVNGIRPDQSNWDWTIMVAFINPSRNQDAERTLSEEIRLKEKGWYKDHFFTVPYDSQPIIFFYPKSKYRNKILNFIKKKPDEIRQMGEKVIEISNAYAQVSSFLFQLQDLMVRQENRSYYNQFNGGSADLYLEQSIEGLARSFNLQLPSCWKNDYAYAGSSNFQSRAQCVSKNIRLEDLNFSVNKMLQQGALMIIGQLTKSHPELSKWIAIAAFAIDFILKMTRKTAIRIIPAIVSSSKSPLYIPNNYSNNVQTSYINSLQGGSLQNAGLANAGNRLQNANDPDKISLFANSQPTDQEFVSVYAFVPHKWQPDADPEVFKLYAPSLDSPCLRAGTNLLKNNDLRLDWLSDSFTKNYKLMLSDKNGWSKEFDLKKNTGLNAWEMEISKEELNLIPKTSSAFEAKITGERGFNDIESPAFNLSVSNGGAWEAELKPSANPGKNTVVLKQISGSGGCSQNVTYKSKTGKEIIFPVTKNNNFIKFSGNDSEISFEIDSADAKPEFIRVQQFGGEMISVTVKQ